MVLKRSVWKPLDRSLRDVAQPWSRQVEFRNSGATPQGPMHTDRTLRIRLYVAMTRGRDEVCLVYNGAPSPFISAMRERLSERPLSFEAPVVLEITPPIVVEVKSDQPAAVVEPALPALQRLAPEPEVITPIVASPAQVAPAETVPGTGTTIEPNLVAIPEPEPTVLNGFTLIPIRGAITVRTISRALGRTIVEIHNDIMDQGVFGTPDEPIRRPFVYRVFEKYGCSPIFPR